MRRKISGLQGFGVIRILPKFRTLTECHTEKRRKRRIIKNKAMKITEALLYVEQRSLFANFIRQFLFKVFTSKVFKKLYATPPSLFVPSAPP